MACHEDLQLLDESVGETKNKNKKKILPSEDNLIEKPIILKEYFKKVEELID